MRTQTCERCGRLGYSSDYTPRQVTLEKVVDGTVVASEDKVLCGACIADARGANLL